MKKLIGVLVLSGAGVGCAHVKAAQLPTTPDSPKVWVSIQSSDEDLSGIYRCTDDGPEPVCKKAKVTH